MLETYDILDVFDKFDIVNIFIMFDINIFACLKYFI